MYLEMVVMKINYRKFVEKEITDKMKYSGTEEEKNSYILKKSLTQFLLR